MKDKIKYLLLIIFLLIISFAFTFPVNDNFKQFEINKEIINNIETDKTIIITIQNQNKIIISDTTKKENKEFNIYKRNVIPSFTDFMVHDIYYSKDSLSVLKLIIEPDYGNIIQIILYIENKKYIYKLKNNK